MRARETAEQSIAELSSLEAESGIPNASLGIEDAVHYASEGKLILLDVRPEEEFAAGHLPHAVNMPIETLGKRVHELPRGMALAAYCRGPYCFLAHEEPRGIPGNAAATRHQNEGLRPTDP